MTTFFLKKKNPNKGGERDRKDCPCFANEPGDSLPPGASMTWPLCSAIVRKPGQRATHATFPLLGSRDTSFHLIFAQDEPEPNPKTQHSARVYRYKRPRIAIIRSCRVLLETGLQNMFAFPMPPMLAMWGLKLRDTAA